MSTTSVVLFLFYLIFIFMIKLIDLIDEIELRDKTFNIPKTNIFGIFFDDYQIRRQSTSKLKTQISDEIYDYIDKKSNIIAKAGDIKLIQPKNAINHYFLVNDDARNNEELNNFSGYLAGFIEADVLSVKEKNLAPYQMTGIEIHLTYVFKGYRGMGLGGIMYQMLLQAYKTVFSDSILYNASRVVWINKLAPMANGSNIIFGGRYNNTIIPLTIEDAANDEISSDIDKYFITTNPPAPLKKITQAIDGLSLSKGEYGIYQPARKIKAQEIDNISSKVNSLEDLIDIANLHLMIGIGDPDKYQKIIIEASDVILVADELGDVEPI